MRGEMIVSRRLRRAHRTAPACKAERALQVRDNELNFLVPVTNRAKKPSPAAMRGLSFTLWQ